MTMIVLGEWFLPEANGRYVSVSDYVFMFVFTVLTCTHIHTNLQEKAPYFMNLKAVGLGTMGLVIIARKVRFDLLLMSALVLSHL